MELVIGSGRLVRVGDTVYVDSKPHTVWGIDYPDLCTPNGSIYLQQFGSTRVYRYSVSVIDARWRD